MYALIHVSLIVMATYSEGASDDEPVDCDYETLTLNMSDSQEMVGMEII